MKITLRFDSSTGEHYIKDDCGVLTNDSYATSQNFDRLMVRYLRDLGYDNVNANIIATTEPYITVGRNKVWLPLDKPIKLNSKESLLEAIGMVRRLIQQYKFSYGSWSYTIDV